LNDSIKYQIEQYCQYLKRLSYDFFKYFMSPCDLFFRGGGSLTIPVKYIFSKVSYDPSPLYMKEKIRFDKPISIAPKSLLVYHDVITLVFCCICQTYKYCCYTRSFVFYRFWILDLDGKKSCKHYEEKSVFFPKLWENENF